MHFMPRTILLVTQAFPPEPVVGALRAANVARTFRDAGYRVVVVTATVNGEAPGQREGWPGVTIHTVALGPRYRERLTRLFRRLQTLIHRAPHGASLVAPGSGGEPRTGSASGLRGLLLSLVWIPDDELRFVGPAYRAARRVLRERVDLVYTTAPSHSTTLIGLLLRRLHGLRWAAEFRDPWCYPHSEPVTPFVERVNRLLERLSIRAADHLVTVTDQTAELYRQRLGPAAGKVVVARNGIPALTGREPHRPGDPFRIIYSGNIYGGRDPRAFIRAIGDVVPECAAAGIEIAVDIFAGETRDVVPLEPLVAELGIGHVVRLPHAEIQRVLRSADLLLLLAQHQPLQVPNKLYEYLGTGVPILAIADEHGETARMLRQAGGHYLVSRDAPGDIARALREAIASRDAAPTIAGEVLNEWLTERQMQHLLAAVRP
jgi:glycosyltransferase involved in cell wall biosynthesis